MTTYLLDLADTIGEMMEFNAGTNQLTGTPIRRICLKGTPLEFPVKPVIVGSFVYHQSRDCGVFLHLQGNLVALVAIQGKNKARTIFLLDGDPKVRDYITQGLYIKECTTTLEVYNKFKADIRVGFVWVDKKGWQQIQHKGK